MKVNIPALGPVHFCHILCKGQNWYNECILQVSYEENIPSVFEEVNDTQEPL